MSKVSHNGPRKAVLARGNAEGHYDLTDQSIKINHCPKRDFLIYAWLYIYIAMNNDTHKKNVKISKGGDQKRNSKKDIQYIGHRKGDTMGDKIPHKKLKNY